MFLKMRHPFGVIYKWSKWILTQTRIFSEGFGRTAYLHLLLLPDISTEVCPGNCLQLCVLKSWFHHIALHLRWKVWFTICFTRQALLNLSFLQPRLGGFTNRIQVRTAFWSFPHLIPCLFHILGNKGQIFFVRPEFCGQKETALSVRTLLEKKLLQVCFVSGNLSMYLSVQFVLSSVLPVLQDVSWDISLTIAVSPHTQI